MKYRYLINENNKIKIFGSEIEVPLIGNITTEFMLEYHIQNWRKNIWQLEFNTPEDEYDVIAHEDLMGKNYVLDVTDITEMKVSTCNLHSFLDYYLTNECKDCVLKVHFKEPNRKPMASGKVFNNVITPMKVNELPNTEYYQPLFDLMTEHNLTLLEGEMDEIIECVTKMIDKQKQQFDSYKLI